MSENASLPSSQTMGKSRHIIDTGTAEVRGDDEKNLRHETLPSSILTGWSLGAVIASLALGMFLVGVDASVIGVAVPRITETFHSLDDIAWYGSAYMLPCTVLQPSFGWFYKTFQVTYVYVVSIVLFEAGSALCAAAPNSTSFIFGRVISGCGAAGIFQGALSIVGITVPKKQIPMYYGYVVSVFGISTSTAPIFGGALTDEVSWRWCFWINLPVGGVMLILIPIFLRIKQPMMPKNATVLERLRELDWLGTLIFTSAMTCFFLALQWGGQTKPWQSPTVIGLLVGFTALLLLFALVQQRMGEQSLIPPRLLKQRTVLFGSIYLALMYLSLSVYLYYLPIYFQAIHGTSATNSGVRIIALDVTRIVFVVISAAVVTKIGSYMPVIVAGTSVAAIGAGTLTMLDMDTTTALSTIWMIVWGIGSGMGANLPFTALQAALNEEDMPLGNGEGNYIRVAPDSDWQVAGISVLALQLGSALGYSLSQTVFITKIFHDVETDVLTQALSRNAILATGAANLQQLSTDPNVVVRVQNAYLDGIKDVLFLALVSVCVAHLPLIGMEWLDYPRSHRTAEPVEASNIDKRTKDIAA